MRSRRTYWVAMKLRSGTWWRLPGSEGAKSYAEGWAHALDSLHPHPAHRLMAGNSLDDTEAWVVEEFPARGEAAAPKWRRA